MDIALTTAGDIDLSTGALQLLEGPAAIAQHLHIRLNFYLAEWYLDQRIGIGYFQTIFVKGQPLNVIRSIFRKAIETTPGVERLLKLDLDFAAATRVLTVPFDANIVGADTPVHFEEEFVI